MRRILGVPILDQKRGEIALTSIHGIGRSLSKKILNKAQIDINKKAGEWTDAESKKIREIINQDYLTGGSLRTKEFLDIERLKRIGCYRGMRHRMRLPVRGQNTKNNARTRKGPGIPIANKRKNSK